MIVTNRLSDRAADTFERQLNKVKTLKDPKVTDPEKDTVKAVKELQSEFSKFREFVRTELVLMAKGVFYGTLSLVTGTDLMPLAFPNSYKAKRQAEETEATKSTLAI